MERIEKIANILAKLDERFDADALLEGVVAVLDRAGRAVADGRISISEAIGIGAAVLQLVKAAAKQG